MRQNREAAALAFDEYRNEPAVLADDGSVLYVLNEGRPEPRDEDVCTRCGDVIRGVRYADDNQQLCKPCADEVEL